jgi:Flp pilus assembly pilin Flp
VQEFVTFYPDAGMITVSSGGASRCEAPAWAPKSIFLSTTEMKTMQEKLTMIKVLAHRFWNEQEGQDIAEYAVMLAVILVIVVGTIRLIGSNANNVFSSVASSIQ